MLASTGQIARILSSTTSSIQDGKIQVTSLWVRHSLDVGMPVDASPTMVGFMGAQFSKPLVANRVTHLICYKFEGEKYELAKRIKKIKLVNHRWLEDCLKAWEILPEDDYSKSGYALEMEAEAAKDSEDETEDINVNQIGEKNAGTSPLGLRNRLLGSHGSPILGRQALHPNQFEGLSTSEHVNNVVLGKEAHRSEHALNYPRVTKVDQLPSRLQDCALNSTGITQVDQHPSRFQGNEDTRDAAKSSGLHSPNTTVSPPKKDMISSCSGSKRSADLNDSKYGSLCYSRKSPKKYGLSLHPVDGGSEYKGKLSGSDTVHVTPSKEHNMEESYVCPKTPLAATSLHDDQGSNGLQCYKRKMDANSDISRGSSKSPKLDSSASKIVGDADILTPINASKGTGKSASIGLLSNHLLESAIPKSLQEASTEKSCSEKKLQESNGGVPTILTKVTVDGSRSKNGRVGKGIGKSTTKSAKKMTNTDRKKAVNVMQDRNAVDVGMQPPSFILSGHRLQRKKFQKIIKRLKGKLCRDSHQWSYQATHFIVPDPVRRVEKFFAAAASGSWILKSDYLSASDQAGKLLAEEPYEWHKNGLSEDGAINLEAPRKWRLLRERTGHGAFYGMRIIIYGECISPPFDTLKRAVKAGDGTILATSPPYTRFLKSEMDFAIVCPGMPRVDIWVQEFLKHNIPCVLADYLVESMFASLVTVKSRNQQMIYKTQLWYKVRIDHGE